MRKRMLAWILTLSMLTGLLAGCGIGKDKVDGSAAQSGSSSQQEEDAPVTRGEWITMLAGAFALVEPQSDTPYFSDVSAGDELFDYVQSSVEWGVLSADADTFDPQDEVTRRTVAETAAFAVGYGLEIDEETGALIPSSDTEGAVAYAQEQGIVDASLDLDGTVTQSECLAALEAARAAYVNVPAGEEQMDVITSASLVDFTTLNDRLEISGQQVRITSGATLQENADGTFSALVETGAGTVELSVDSVIVTPGTALDPAGVAYKIAAIRADGDSVVLDTVTPELGDLYDELFVNTTVSADPADIIWADGIYAAPVANGAPGEFQITLLSNSPQAVPMADLFNKSFSFGNGAEKTWTNQNSSSLGTTVGAQALENSNFVYTDTPSIEDFGGTTDSWTKDLKVENKFSAGYNISGNITISSIDVSPKIEFKKAWGIPYGVKSASVTVKSDITSTLTLTGNLSNELMIGTVPIPIGPTGLSVSVDLYLYVNASGMLEVRAALSPTAKVEYTSGGFKQSASCTAETHAELAIEIDFGANLQVALRALGMTVVDAGVKAGAAVTAGAYVGGSVTLGEENGMVKTTYQQAMNLEADLYYPIVSISVSGLGKSKTWEVISKGSAQHTELVREEWVFWEETILTENDEVVSDEVEEGDEALAGASDEARLDLDTYMFTLTDDSTRQLTVTQGSGDVLWSSDNPVAAVVDSNGVVTPLGNGTAVITATLASDPSVFVKCVVYVQVQEEHDWEFLPASMTIAV